MSKELATLIEDAKRSLWDLRGYVSFGIDCINEYKLNHNDKNELRNLTDTLAQIRIKVEKLAEFEEELKTDKFF